ncbi:MAG: beta-lactamase/prolyl oligopeptidase [Labilithrix sp.]|nr:beta-lactamase/prolyl oligopeptidase [Labilithrix sp.]
MTWPRAASLTRREALSAAVGAAAWAAGCRPAERLPPASVPAAITPRVDPRWERVVRAFESSLEACPAPGGAIGVVLDGKPAFTAARGVRKLGTSALVTTSTLFRLESVTKTFTALTALSLVERLALDLDAPVTDLVPWVSFADREMARQVTLRRLLTHTAGLGRNQILRLRDVRRGFEYEDLFGKNALTLGPLDQFEYSNTGYLLVGAAIERASRRSFDDALRTFVTTPLGMVTATTDSSVAAAREHAEGFGIDEDGRERSFDAQYLDPYVQRPVGGLHASIDELCLFAARLLDGVPEVLRPATFADMTKRHVATPERDSWYGYGIYGVDSPRGPVWTHTGAGLGSTAYFVCAPRHRFALVATTNAGRYRGWRDVRRAAEETFLGAPLF